MQRTDCRAGFTLVEVMAAVGIFSMIFMAGYTMLQTASGSFDKNRRQTHADVDATLALGHMVSDLREAQSFSVVPNGIDMTYPMLNGGFYDRYTMNSNGPTIQYYLNEAKADGTFTLWRRDLRLTDDPGTGPDERERRLCRNIESIICAPDSDLPNAVIITLRAKYTRDQNRADTDGDAKVTVLSQRVVHCRNYNPEWSNP